MPDKVLFLVISDLLINLSAGWIGALIIVPNYSQGSSKRKLIILTMDIIFAIFSLMGAYQLRKL